MLLPWIFIVQCFRKSNNIKFPLNISNCKPTVIFSYKTVQMCSGFIRLTIIREGNIGQLLMEMICVSHYKWLLIIKLTPTIIFHSHEFLRQESKKAKKKNFIISIWLIMYWVILPGLKKLLKLSLLSFMGDNMLSLCLSQFKYECLLLIANGILLHNIVL